MKALLHFLHENKSFSFLDICFLGLVYNELSDF